MALHIFYEHHRTKKQKAFHNRSLFCYKKVGIASANQTKAMVNYKWVYEIRERKSPGGEIRKRAYDVVGEPVEWEEIFEAFMHYGGMPGIADVGLVQDRAHKLFFPVE